MRFRMIDSAKKQYTYWPKSTLLQMPRCIICAEKRRKVFQLCSACKPDDAKRTCLKSNAEMCFMCPAKSDCLAIRLVCPYCQTASEFSCGERSFPEEGQ